MGVDFYDKPRISRTSRFGIHAKPTALIAKVASQHNPKMINVMLNLYCLHYPMYISELRDIVISSSGDGDTAALRCSGITD